MKIRGSVVSLRFIFPHPPEDKEKKKSAELQLRAIDLLRKRHNIRPLTHSHQTEGFIFGPPAKETPSYLGSKYGYTQLVVGIDISHGACKCNFSTNSTISSRGFFPSIMIQPPVRPHFSVTERGKARDQKKIPRASASGGMVSAYSVSQYMTTNVTTAERSWI